MRISHPAFILSLALLLLGAQGLSAQTLRAYRLAGDRAFEEQDYYAAMLHYGEALRINDKEAALLHRYAETAQRFYAFEEAEKYYRKALALDSGTSLTLFRLGEVAKSTGRYAAAREHFQAYLDLPSGQAPPTAAKAKAEIAACTWAENLLLTAAPAFALSRLGKAVNSPYSDFGAVARGDTIYFSSYRFDKKKDSTRPARKVTKLMAYTGGRSARPLPAYMNSDERHTAHTAFSRDGQRMYYTVCDFVNTTKIRCELYYRDRDRRGRWQKQATRLPPTINITNQTMTQPAIGYDSTIQAEVLYFASDRPGGTGGMDIWRSVLGQDGKPFGQPENLSAVNTTADELTPWFDEATQTLYFSTDGRQTLGGYDIYRYRPGSEPEHLGLPFNSSYNDLYYSLAPGGQSGYLASNRPGSAFLDVKNKSCCNDIYFFEALPPPPSQVPSDTLPPPPQPPTASTPSPKDNTPAIPTRLEDFLPLALYFDNDEPDKRTRKTTTRKSYGETYARYIRRQSEYRQAYAAPLPEADRAEAEAETEEFFANDLQRGYDFLFRFSDILLERLEAGEQVEIFIKGFTSPRAKSDYNLLLGQRRVSSVRNHFDTYRDGVFRPYLKGGKLIVSERSFGDTTADEAVSSNLEDVRNSIYNPAAARERRVEIVEIKRE